ncbi:MAG: hypothetical protein HQK51_08165 [Oligoflexia bacterium]|nr:hypothetical protein [Oligoflexia bacterium]
MEMEFNKKKLINTVLLITGVIVGTTFIYFKINPRPNFKTTVTQAGQMALAGLQQQLPQQQLAPSEQVQIQGQIQAPDQLGQGVQTQNQTQIQNQAQDQFISGGQYVCSQCGHTGLPNFDQNGTPHCSECGGVMNINKLDANEAVQICNGANCPTTASTTR